MAIKWSRVAPQLALTPSLAVTLAAFVGAIIWSVYLSFTASRRFPDYTIVGLKQYQPAVQRRGLDHQPRKHGDPRRRQPARHRFGLHPRRADRPREVAGKAIFRTLFLYPLAVSLIVTGIAWRWLFNPTMGIQNFLHTHGLTFINFNWLAAPETVMYGIILGVVWQSTGFYMALMLAGLKSINIEIWQAAKVDGVPFWRLYFEVIIPMMKLTFLTAILLLSIGVVKAYDIVVAMTNGGPGGNSYVPAYFAIQAYWVKRNLGFASSAATIMLLMTFLLFLPFVLFRAEGRVVTQAALDVPAAPRRSSQRARRKPIKPHRIAIFVFLLMAALFFCVPLYVIVITSFKTMDEIRLGQIFALPEVWSLVPAGTTPGSRRAPGPTATVSAPAS